MAQRNVVIGGDAVAQRGEALLDTLHHHGVGQRVTDVHELLISRRVRQDQSFLVTNTPSE